MSYQKWLFPIAVIGLMGAGDCGPYAGVATIHFKQGNGVRFLRGYVRNIGSDAAALADVPYVKLYDLAVKNGSDCKAIPDVGTACLIGAGWANAPVAASMYPFKHFEISVGNHLDPTKDHAIYAFASGSHPESAVIPTDGQVALDTDGVIYASEAPPHNTFVLELNRAGADAFEDTTIPIQHQGGVVIVTSTTTTNPKLAALLLRLRR